jgi:hypothetical protein
MAVVLALAGLVSLANIPRHHGTQADRTRRSGTLLAGEDLTGASGNAEVGPPPLPLFPTTSSTRPSKTAATSAIAAAAVSATTAGSVTPVFGTYAYDVTGTEALTGFGSRTLPSTMTLTIKRGAAAGDMAVDLSLGANHTEHEVVAAGAELIALRASTITAVFGPVTRNVAATYDVPVGRAVLPLAAASSRTGASVAHDAAGTTLRTEDWKVTDVASQTMTVGGAATTVWEVTLSRTSRAGASEPLKETRRAWFDPARGIWVKWETHLHDERGVSSYELDYTATLRHD